MDEVSKYFSYAHRISLNSRPSSLNHRNFNSDLETLRKDGTLVLENFIPAESLNSFKQILHNRIEDRYDFEMPCLSQSKVNRETHREVIDNKFKYSNASLNKLGLCFSKNDIHSYEQMLRELKPTTLKLYLEDNKESYDLWLNTYLLNLIEGYMGMIPYMTEAYVRRNFPSDFRVMNHNWHRDQNHDKYLLKAFYFLTDCEIEHGPHEFVIGSHKDFTISGKDYFEDSEIDSLYPPGSAKRFVSKVKAGTVVLEDTRGLHRASVPKQGYRDLGFAIFVPAPFWRPHKDSFYKISKSVVDSLSNQQRRYIPDCSIV